MRKSRGGSGGVVGPRGAWQADKVSKCVLRMDTSKTGASCQQSNNQLHNLFSDNPEIVQYGLSSSITRIDSYRGDPSIVRLGGGLMGDRHHFCSLQSSIVYPRMRRGDEAFE